MSEKTAKFQNYLFEYRHGGKKWGLTISAESENDAFARIYAIRSATFLGTEITTIPVRRGLMSRLVCWTMSRRSSQK